MADWDRFEIDNHGKVIIYKINKMEVKKLDVIRLPKRTYFVDKEYLAGLNEYTPETLKDTPIYSLVGTDQGSNEKKGITIEIRELKKLNRLEEFIQEINSVENINAFMMSL